MVSYDDLLALIPDEEIQEYLDGRDTDKSAGHDLPPWHEIKIIYTREGRDGVIDLFARAYHTATGTELL